MKIKIKEMKVLNETHNDTMKLLGVFKEKLTPVNSEYVNLQISLHLKCCLNISIKIAV